MIHLRVLKQYNCQGEYHCPEYWHESELVASAFWAQTDAAKPLELLLTRPASMFKIINNKKNLFRNNFKFEKKYKKQKLYQKTPFYTL